MKAEPGRNPFFRFISTKLIVGISCAILACGTLVACLEARGAASLLRKEMLVQARMLAASFDVHSLYRLSGSANDLDSVDYHQLRDTLIRIRAANPSYRYLYFMGKQSDGQYFFYMGTAPDGAADYSPPGQVYAEDSPALALAFDKGQASISPAFTDNWGTWRSALMPIKDLSSDRVRAVFGMDYESGGWTVALLRRAATPVFLSLFMIACFMASSFFMRQRFVQENEAFKKRVFEQSAVPMVIMDPDTWEFIDGNPAAAKIYGFPSVARMLGKTPLDVSPKYQQGGTSSAERAKSLIHKSGSGETLNFPWLHLTPDGREWDAEVQLLRFESKGKNLLQFTVRDITENNRQLSEIRREKDFSEMLLTGLPGIFALFDRAQGLRRWNRNLESASGYAKEELLGKSFASWFLTEEERDRAGLRFREAFDSDKTITIECTPVSKAGMRVPYLLSVSRVDMAEGPMVMIVGLDIGPQVKAEAEREKLRLQLAQAQKLESIGLLAGGVAHDFNNILQCILGNMELALMEAESGSELSGLLQDTKNAALRSADLTKSLLAFARKQPVAPRKLDLNRAISESLGMLKPIIGENIQVSWVPGLDLGMVRIDPVQVDQILTNLLVNARDAITGSGTITVETTGGCFDGTYCDLHPGLQPGSYVVVTVSDNGSGIDPSTLPHIFEPFFSTKKGNKGTGLGLATIYGIVRQNDGFITVYSEPGLGSSFKVYLPRESGGESESVAPGQDSGTVVAGGATGKTVLLVEDDSMILKIIRHHLVKMGFRVLCAAGPLEAISIAKDGRESIDVLITDVIMPDMSGRELADILGASRQDLKCLFMSGYTADHITQKGVLAEGVHFLQKPFSAHELSEKLDLVFVG